MEGFDQPKASTVMHSSGYGNLSPPAAFNMGSPDDHHDSSLDAVPDIAQVFTMYKLNEPVERPPYRQSRTHPETGHWDTGGTPSVNQGELASRGIDLAEPLLQQAASSDRPYRNASPEKRARERAPVHGRSSTYAGMAPAPSRQRSGIGDGYARTSPSKDHHQRYTAPVHGEGVFVRPLTSDYSGPSYDNFGMKSPDANSEPSDDSLVTDGAAEETFQGRASVYHPNEVSDSSFANFSRSTSVSSFGQRSQGLPSPVVTDRLSSQALDLIDEGKSKTIDSARVARWGGPVQLVTRLENEKAGQFDGGVIEDLKGSTHVLLSSHELRKQIFPLLAALLPIICGSLVVLDVHDSLLQGLPDGLSRCHALEELNISGNPISEVPIWLGELVNLRVAMMDDCNLRSLPSSLMAAQYLHTICVRRNRLISLPSWLSQLPRLEMLLIDGNPFVGPWKTLSETIATPSPATRNSRVLERADSFSRQPREVVNDFTIRSTAMMQNLDDQAVNVATNHTQLMQNLDDQAVNVATNYTRLFERSSPANPPGETSQGSNRIPKGLRRMQSANALLSVGLEHDRRPQMHVTASATATLGRAGLGVAQDERTAAVSDEEDDMEILSMPKDEPTVTNKGRKWGFLRKMSMGKMRASSLNNNQTAPPVPEVRGRISSAPSQEGSIKRKLQKPTLEKLDVSGQKTTSRYDRGKRRSFLPVLEGPPLLNVAIPSFSASPFSVSSLSLHGPSESDSMGKASADESPASSINPPSGPSSRGSQPASALTYQTGLKSVISYLGDLYDLSLPVPAVLGGAEVIQSDPGTTSASISVTSEARSGASSPHIGTNAEPNRHMGIRNPTPQNFASDRSRAEASPNGPLSPALTDRSGTGEMPSSRRPPSVAKAAEEVATSLKRYKDDPLVRHGVIKHIIDTERSYVRGLQDLVSIYVRPASQPISKGDMETVIPANERKIVFGGVEGILQFHSQSFLPALEKAAEPLLRSKQALNGDSSQRLAIHIANVFKQYHPFMRQYSAYINNFDFALMRLESWTGAAEKAAAHTGSSQAESSTGHHDVATSLTAGAITAGLGIASGGPLGKSGNAPSHAGLTIAQRKRIKSFLKQCRKHPRHTQLNLESYLLLPVQRIPRYRMLLEDLARCTPPHHDSFGDPIEDALQEMVTLASTMNEEKRDSESRRKLVKWQQRIRGRFATPLVQAHRRLLLDGQLVITRNVKRSATLVEVPEHMVSGDDNHDRTITSAKSIVQVETLAPEVMERPVLVLLATDMMLLCKDPSHGRDPDCTVELFAVLKLQTKRRPASVINGNGIRLVDNRNILYLSAPTTHDAYTWVQTINDSFESTR